MRPLRSQDGLIPSPPPEEIGTYNSTHNHQICPVEESSRPDTPVSEQDEVSPDTPIVDCIDGQPTQEATPPPEAESASETESANICESPSGKPMPMEHPDDGPVNDLQPSSDRTSNLLDNYPSDTDQKLNPTALQVPALPVISPWPRTRFLPNSTTSFLRPGSCFKGTQQSDRQVYNVKVDIKHVDMSESYLCGYLRIQGLTPEHPTLTTFFEGEIIGTKYTFQTRHAEWGSNDKVDMQHWARFAAWRPLSKAAKRSDFSYRNFAQRDYIFMRWKEQFLVPDHQVKDINGASFEGFYYICFNQLTGHISGIYFHAKSERYQQLELNRVEDHGCLGAIEFR